MASRRTSVEDCMAVRFFGGTRVPPTPAHENTNLCQDFVNGTCRRGNRCRFSHLSSTPFSDRQRVESSAPRRREDDRLVPRVAPTGTAVLCQDFVNGTCHRGNRCHLSHITSTPFSDRQRVESSAPVRLGGDDALHRSAPTSTPAHARREDDASPLPNEDEEHDRLQVDEPEIFEQYFSISILLRMNEQQVGAVPLGRRRSRRGRTVAEGVPTASPRQAREVEDHNSYFTQHVAGGGLSRVDLEALPVGTGCGRDCRICLCVMAEDEAVTTLPCFDRYHKECIDRWLSTTSCCPLCKLDVEAALKRL